MTLDTLSLGIGLCAGVALASVVYALLNRSAQSAFHAVSADALNANNQAFLALAEQHLGRLQESARGDFERHGASIQSTVEPMARTLETLNLKLQEVEKERASAQGELRQHFATLSETHGLLRTETGRLVQALRSPMGRGSWGEMQLERLLELAGMQAGVHYDRQATASNEDRTVRPDIVIRLSGGKSIVVDAKTPMDAYLSAIETPDDETRAVKLKAHAAQVRDQMKKLAAKEYWKMFSPSPEFVVMFMPSEGAAASALQHDLDLVEAGMRAGVVIATPMTFFALLRTIVYGWRQEKLAENAAEIAKLGAELYERIGGLADTQNSLGAHLVKAVQAYNKGINQLERRILPSARKLRDQHEVSGAAEIPALTAVEETLGYFTAAEMVAGQDAASDL
jgi:DNA recombination protein RmuC